MSLCFTGWAAQRVASYSLFGPVLTVWHYRQGPVVVLLVLSFSAGSLSLGGMSSVIAHTHVRVRLVLATSAGCSLGGKRM